MPAKHKARRIWPGHYVYREYVISERGTNINGRVWAVSERDVDGLGPDEPGERVTFEWTLTEAKQHVDRIRDEGHNCDQSKCDYTPRTSRRA